MGQLNGKASYIQSIKPFLNICEKDINLLWESFNDIAEGFGINKDEMIDICGCLQETFDIKVKNEMEKLSSALFLSMDTDENGLVDALEFLGMLSILSAMKISEKLTFVFNCYDFDETGQITIDELTLALKSTLTGLCKISISTICPSEAALEEISIKAFQRFKKDMESSLTLQEFLFYCETTPEIQSWIIYYDTPEEIVQEIDLYDSDLEKEYQNVETYTDYEVMMQDPNDPTIDRIKLDEISLEENKSVPPWINTIANCTPSNPPEINETLPDTRLYLDWIYGYNNNFRNNVRYLSTGEIFYPSGNVHILYDINEHKQRYFLQHTNTILSCTIHPNHQIIATGEKGKRPNICIWNMESLELITNISGFHNNGISHIEWNKNLRGIISIGMDCMHSIAIYEWETKDISLWNTCLPKLIFAHISTFYNILGCLSLTSDLFITCGIQHIYFWYKIKDKYIKKKGCFNKKGKKQTIISLCKINETNVLSGTISGELLEWEGRNCIRIIRGHSSTVNCLYSFNGGFLSGGKDGKIRIWSRSMESGAQFDVQALGSLNPKIKSLCTNQDGTKILLSTAGNEIYEIAACDGCNIHFGPIVSGHYKNELWGLSCHPFKNEFCTVGDDQTIRIWDFITHRMIKMTELEMGSRACSYSPDGSSIAIGLGTNYITKQKKEGAFCIINQENLQIKYEARDSKKWIRKIKFSKDGQTLSIGSNDNYIYLYNTDDYASKGKCKLPINNSIVSNFDFSLDGDWLQVNCSENNQIYYFDAKNGKENTRAISLKDIQWATWTCPYGWPVQGIWPINNENYNVIAVACSTTDPTILVSGDNFGKIKVFRYPVIKKGESAYLELSGHSGIIQNIIFHSKEEYLFSCGRTDRCIFQWKIEREPMAEPVKELDYQNTSDDEIDFIDGIHLERNLLEEKGHYGDIELSIAIENQLGPKDIYTPKPSRPWVATSIIPTDNNNNNNNKLNQQTNSSDETTEILTLPESNLELEWIHGYRTHDCRDNLHYNKLGKIIYHVAGIGIIYDKINHNQLFYKEHTDDIISFAIHPDKIHIATGQLGRFPKINIWNSITLETISSFYGQHRYGINELCFTNNGKYLMSIGLDINHTIIIYDWYHHIQIGSIKGSKDKILCVKSLPDNNNNNNNNNILFVTCGINHIYFWIKEHSNRNIVYKKGLLNKKGKNQTFLSIGFIYSKDTNTYHTIIGTINGEIYKFNGRDLIDSIMAHESSIYAMDTNDYTNISSNICTAGKDGMIKIWSQELECLSEFNLKDLNPISYKIRSIEWDRSNNKILIGTRASEIYEISSIDGSTLYTNNDNLSKSFIQSHYKGTLYGLSYHPKKDQYCTVGDDKTLRIWDINKKQMIKKLDLETMSRACDYSSDGLYIAIGLGNNNNNNNDKIKHKKDGTFLIYQSDDLQLIHEARDTKLPITCIRYSPDNLSLIIGSSDHSIYIYDINNNYSKRAIFSKHKSPIMFIDITKDGQYLRSICEGSELLFADITTGSHVVSGKALRNQKWHTTSCFYNWAVQGIWPNKDALIGQLNSIQITALTRSNLNGKNIVAADNYGNLKLYRYPCITSGGIYGGTTRYKLYKGHGGDMIRNLCFTQNDSHVISIGANSNCIFQWKYYTDEIQDESQIIKPNEDDSDIEDETTNYIIKIKDKIEENKKPTGARSYLSSMVPPTNPMEEKNEIPKIKLTLEHVYGYKSQDIRNNLFFSNSGNIIYPVGSIGISYDRSIHKQNFYTGHNGKEIGSIAISTCGNFIATGETLCPRPIIHIWQSNSCLNISKLSSYHEKSIKYCTFSSDGKLIGSIGGDDNHSLCIWESLTNTWKDPIKLASTKNTHLKVLFILFSMNKNLFYIITGGVNHITFWRLDPPLLIPIKGIFGTRASIQTLTCGANVARKIVTGTLSGHLYIWEGRTIDKSIHGHSGTINSIYSVQLNDIENNEINTKSNGCITGGKDGHVKLWSSDFIPLADFNINEIKPVSLSSSIRSVCWDTYNNRILIGTKASEIYEISTCTGLESAILLMEGHCSKNELHGLAFHPNSNEIVVTAGNDKTIRLWNIITKKIISKLVIDSPIHCITFSPDGSFLAAGLGSNMNISGQRKDGGFIIINVATMEILFEGRESKLCINDIKYSPDGTLLAIASQDHIVYFHNVLDNYRLRYKFDKSTGRIIHMDFSADSNYMRINSDTQELLFLNTSDGNWISGPSTLKDSLWFTNSCVYTWSTQGIWPNNSTDWYCLSTEQLKKNPFIISTDDKGIIKIYNYPCISKNLPHYEMTGHGSFVTNVKYNVDETYVVTIGGKDRSLYQWKIEITE